MAKLRIKAADGKTLVVDVGDADKSEYDDLAAAALADYTEKNKAPLQPTATDPGVTAGDVGRAALSTVKDVGNLTKAGYAGVADLIAGNGLDKSVENIHHVEKGEDTTSAASTIGEALGAQFTPGMIAAQAVAGKIGEAVGPWVGKLLKGWAEDAAVNAVGKIKTIAKSLGVDDLDKVGRFLLSPISLNGKEFEPIVTATSSPQEMLDAARKVASAAGKQLESVSGAVDTAAKATSDELASSANGTVAETLSSSFPLAKGVSDGRAVRTAIPNTSSISASLNDYEELKGIRDVPFSAFPQMGKLSYVSATEKARTLSLARQIAESGEVNPLIVVLDKEGPYILEGGHRFDALRELGAKSFPALVVRDTESLGAGVPAAPILDFPALRTSVEKLKEEAVGDLPNLGKPVAKQFNDALADLEEYMRTQATTANEDAFSKLSAIKTKIGNLVFKHGSPLESKAALQDVYHAVSDSLEAAAKKVGGETAEQYAQANSVYHQSMSIVSALEGKVVDAKKWFDAPSFLAAMSAGFATHGPAAAVTVPAAYIGMKTAQNYAPQAIAAGLEATHPLVAKGIALTARGIPVVANAISQALGQ